MLRDGFGCCRHGARGELQRGFGRGGQKIRRWVLPAWRAGFASLRNREQLIRKVIGNSILIQRVM